MADDITTTVVTAITDADIDFNGLSGVTLDDPKTVVSTLLEQAGVFALTKDSIIEDVLAAVERLDGILDGARLDEPRRELARVRVLQHCRIAQIKDARPIVDSVLKRRKSTTEEPERQSVALVDDPPSAAPADGAQLLDETAQLIRRHVVVSDARATAIALWVAAAYAINALSLMPILLITAATMRSGKTTLLTLLSGILPRALAASNLTGAVLARAIAAFRPTLLADEADTWLTDESSELRGIMNAGHTRATAFVLRCAAETHEPQLIPCFGARVISMIRRPPSTIGDRAIIIELRRKKSDESVERLRVDSLRQVHADLRGQWRRWADDHLHVIRDADPAVPKSLHDRAADNWRPLLAVADIVGGTWPARARAAAAELSGVEDAEEESIAIELLADIRSVFEGAEITSADLTTALVALSDRPWAEWSHGRPMTAVKLAGRLKPFGIRTRKVRHGARTVNAYLLTDFLDAWGRYLPSESEQSEQVNDSGPELQISRLGTDRTCSELETAENPNEIRHVPTVPSQTGVSEAVDDDRPPRHRTRLSGQQGVTLV